MHVYRSTSDFDERVPVEPVMDYPVAFAKSPDEFLAILHAAKQLGYLDVVGETNDVPEVSLRTTGWRRVQQLNVDRAKADQAFVAMWFDPSVSEAYTEGIVPALQDCGYEPFRVDEPEHNGKIDDLIVAEIRRSGLLIADFTDHRGGVYFEAGLAMGLGIPVVWTCRADHIDRAHFDTRQYNHIVWETPVDLRTKLRNRVAATAPRGGPSRPV
ncbi:hypothetical protein BSZ37_16995 [Rubrivirga marina]|uniref:Nucleoside 2-deoxyribosyltransferase n=2 Tax=Rubrivirga marina TaxID=1196024 RepID=A0A271J5M9_9BACT|nr:hypothetical protein BSZ37_16995 [Rubrivirga marina]